MRLKILWVLVLFAPFSNSASFSHTGKIDTISSITTREGSDYMLLTGFSEAGSCPTSAGMVVARFPTNDGGNRSFSIALASKMADKEVTLAVDDDVKHPEDGGCLVKSLRLKN